MEKIGNTNDFNKSKNEERNNINMNTNNENNNETKKGIMQAIKFFMFSATAAIIDVTAFFILRNVFNVRIDIAEVISVILSVLYNFTINRKYTFKSTNKIVPAMIKVALFYAVFIPFAAYLSVLLKEKHIHDAIIKGMTLALNGIGEFFWWKYVVFKEEKTSN